MLCATVSIVSSFMSSGLEPNGNVVGAPARFTVETFGAGKGDVEVVVLNPKGAPEKV